MIKAIGALAVLLATVAGIPTANAASMVQFALQLEKINKTPQGKALAISREQREQARIKEARDEAAGKADQAMRRANNAMAIGVTSGVNQATQATGGKPIPCRYYGCVSRNTPPFYEVKASRARACPTCPTVLVSMRQDQQISAARC